MGVMEGQMELEEEAGLTVSALKVPDAGGPSSRRPSQQPCPPAEPPVAPLGRELGGESRLM